MTDRNWTSQRPQLLKGNNGYFRKKTQATTDATPNAIMASQATLGKTKVTAIASGSSATVFNTADAITGDEFIGAALQLVTNADQVATDRATAYGWGFVEDNSTSGYTVPVDCESGRQEAWNAAGNPFGEAFEVGDEAHVVLPVFGNGCCRSVMVSAWSPNATTATAPFTLWRWAPEDGSITKGSWVSLSTSGAVADAADPAVWAGVPEGSILFLQCGAVTNFGTDFRFRVHCFNHED